MGLNLEKLTMLAGNFGRIYQMTKPYPHIVFDDFMDGHTANTVTRFFPKSTSMNFYKYDNQLEKKLAMDKLDKLPTPITSLIQQFNSAPFLEFLEKLTGIDGLIPDPHCRGGGIHQIEPGGKLDVHIDFNIHPKLKLHRRLNAILYLNKDWKEEYGGHFEIWEGHKDGDQHVLDRCMQRILPVYNRFVLFNTSEKSYHGHPDPLKCPTNMTRKSIALYYYTASRPADEVVDSHSTTFVKRPQDPNDLQMELLRQRRNQSRLTTNIK